MYVGSIFLKAHDILALTGFYYMERPINGRGIFVFIGGRINFGLCKPAKGLMWD